MLGQSVTRWVLFGVAILLLILVYPTFYNLYRGVSTTGLNDLTKAGKAMAIFLAGAIIIYRIVKGR